MTMLQSSGWSTFRCWTMRVSETDSSPVTGSTGFRALERAPFRAWLVTGPVGRLIGFVLDFAKALRAHLKEWKASRGAKRAAPR